MSSPISSESEEEEEDDEPQNSFESRENGLYGQEEQHEEVEEAREGKTRTLPKGPTAEQIRVPHTFVKELMMMEEYQQYVSIIAS